MKTATYQIDEDNEFKLRSLSIRQILAVQERQDNPSPELVRYRKLAAKAEAHENDPQNNPALTGEEQKEQSSLRDAELREMAYLCRLSLSRYHKEEYGITNDPNEDRKRTDALFDIADMDDMDRISRFAMSGDKNVLEEGYESTVELTIGDEE